MSRDHCYTRLKSEPTPSRSNSVRQHQEEKRRVFEELPKVSIISVSRPDVSDFSPLLLTYTIELQYKQFKWQLVKKPSQAFSLHFALKKRVIIEEFYEKQEQVKEWLQNLGIGDQTSATDYEDEQYEDFVLSSHEENSSSKKNIPSKAVFPIIKPTLRSQECVSDRAKLAMKGYLDHFLGNLDIANSREVCKFLEVSKLSFLPEYGPKLKEGYVMVKHLPKVQKGDDARCCSCWFSCCDGRWQLVWAVLKPGFVAFLEDPFKDELLDIIVFDILPSTNGKEENQASLVKEVKERNPLRHGFQVSSGNRKVKIRVNNSTKVQSWITAINDAVLSPCEGWCHPHRYGSFAPSRGLTEDGSMVQWFVDGHAAFDAIASSIEKAKSEIFITGWWVCPELYLRRPFHAHQASRLDALLEAKAKQGVQIYILLYKEVPLALKINSIYSKRKLLSIHENVKVIRYPDHISTGIYLWSHHEKIVIIDYQICYIGGLDLCFGRYDTPEHKISDNPPTVWPGKDYYNPRESEPNSWEDTMKDELDRAKYPRMPWHDVQCALWGPPCRDVARHFVQRWNHAKRSKAPNEQAIPLLMPWQYMVLPHYMGNHEEMNGECKEKYEKQKERKVKDSFPTCSSYPDVPLLLPRESEKQDAHKEEPKPNRSDVVNNVIDALWKPQQHGDNGSINADGQVGRQIPCQCQIIRSVDYWSAGTSQKEESIHSAYFSLIEKAKHFIYIENQFFISGLSGDDIIKNRVLEALYRRIIRAHTERKCFRVIVVIPLLPGFRGGLSDGGAATVRALVHWQLRTISRGPSSLLRNLYDRVGAKAHDYISFYGLRTYGKLHDEGLVATNQIYVHSKLMIVDDRLALIGSANINDRSLLGSRDSEIAVVVEDKDFVDSLMDGKPWKAGKFSYSLRLTLWSEHLGLEAKEIGQVTDPVTDATYKEIWMRTSEENTRIYEDVFQCSPNNSINSRAIARQTISQQKERLGHTTVDLGIAPDIVKSYKNGETKDIDPLERLQAVRGRLVCFPLEFMSEEDLRPGFIETEFYTAPQVFH